MTDLIYLDTNIYISYFKEESDYLRPISDFAFELFKKTLSCQYTIVFSGWVAKELDYKLPTKQVTELLEQLKTNNKLRTINADNKDIQQAKQTTNWPDRLHEILAKKAGAKYLVTRNLKDFNGDLVEIKLPESL